MKKTVSSLPRNALLVAALLFAPSFAFAHTGAGPTSGLMHGFAHPLGGLDHLCAMLAVGLWAAQMGGRALWAVPATFVGVMALGGALGMMGIAVPRVEEGILISVLMLGVFIAAAVRLPLWASMTLVGLFAICHGHAHGAEMPENSSGLFYAVGFILATALLHAVGIGLGVFTQRISKPLFVRLAGATIAACGVALFFVS